MAITIAAQAEGGIEQLWYLVTDEFLASPLAKERALAASILAWIGDERAIHTLEQLVPEDPSQWVRAHAEWAAEVARGECSSKRFYQQLLHETDPMALSARLEVLQAALTPTARWWHFHVEQTEPDYRNLGRVAGVIEAFWSEWTHAHPRSVKVYGRELNKYCRGEELQSPRPPQLAPWWRP